MDYESLKKSGEWDDLIKKLNDLGIPLEKIAELTEQDFIELGIGIVRQAKLKSLFESAEINQPPCNNDIVLNHPTIISHEYARLFELLKQKQYFGLLLQVRDVFEVILKFPVLITVADFFHKDTRNKKENRLLLNMFERPLTLGIWENLARTLKNLENTEPLLKGLLKMLSSEYESNQIRKWRNDRIGHGALALKADQTFLNEIHSKIALISEILEKCSPYYQEMSFSAQSEKQSLLNLKGKDALKSLSGKMNLYIKINEKIISGYPLILIDDQSIYFYDSYLSGMKTVSMLDYIQGDKLDTFSTMEQWIENNITFLGKEIALDKIGEHVPLDNEAYSLTEESIYEKLKDIDDYIEPKHLTKWLKKILSENDKGVFLVQMERGTGKSTFARSLDDFSGIHKPLKDKNIMFRGYYINDSYTYRPHVFTQKTNDLLRMDHKNNLIIGGIEAVSSKSSFKSKDFATLLNRYCNEYKSGRYSQKAKKIVLIIDGLDEIPATDQASIFEFIPKPEQLNKGVFIFLTCRTNQEISGFTTRKLNRLKLSAVKEVKTSTNENQTMIIEYIEREMNKFLASAEEISNIAKKAEYRFLYARAYKELFENVIINSAKEIPEAKCLFETYLTHLKSSYGEKYYKKLTELLVAVGSSFEPITIRELAYLNNEKPVSFNLLAYLLDISLFLRIERSSRENSFSLSHDDWNRAIENLFNYEIANFSSKQVERAFSQLNKNIQWSDQKYDGLTYLLAYLPDYIKQAQTNILLNNKHIKSLKRIADSMSENLLKEYQRERVLMIYTTILSAEKAAGKAKESAWTLLNKGKIHQTLMQYDDAMFCYDEALQLIYESDDTTVKVLLNAAKGALCRDRGKLRESITLLGKAICELESTQKPEKFKPGKTETLATIYKDRGYAKRLTGLKELLQEALQDLETAYQLYQKLLQDNQQINEEEYSSVVMNRGAVLNDIGRHDDAINDYESAKRIRERLIKEKKMRDKSLLCSTLMNLGYAYFCSGNGGKGEQYCKRAIQLCYELQATGELPNEDYIATAYTFLGRGYALHNMYSKACSSYTEAVKVKEDLLQKNKLPNPNSLEKVKKKLKEVSK